MRVFVCIYIYTYIYINIYHVYIHMRVCMHLYIYICVSIHRYIYMQKCVRRKTRSDNFLTSFNVYNKEYTHATISNTISVHNDEICTSQCKYRNMQALTVKSFLFTFATLFLSDLVINTQKMYWRMHHSKNNERCKRWVLRVSPSLVPRASWVS